MGRISVFVFFVPLLQFYYYFYVTDVIRTVFGFTILYQNIGALTLMMQKTHLTLILICLSLYGFPAGALISSHSPKTLRLFELVTQSALQEEHMVPRC